MISSTNYKIFPTALFMREARKLKKKYPQIRDDFKKLADQLKKDPITGNDPLGSNCYKLRMEISGNPAGKSGGARIIIQVFVKDYEVHVLSVYDKSGTSTIYEEELDKILKNKILIWQNKVDSENTKAKKK